MTIVNRTKEKADELAAVINTNTKVEDSSTVGMAYDGKETGSVVCA